MKALQDTPTAELLAEWGKLNKLNDYIYRTTHDEDAGNVDSMSAISAELDRRCEGIRNVNGFPAFGNYRQIIYAKNDPNAREAVVKIRIADLHDLLTWLLLKGGNG